MTRKMRSPRPKTEAPGRGNEISDTAVCAWLFGLAALARVLFLSGTMDRLEPWSVFYYGDSRLYREFALAVMRGESFDNGIPFHPPLFAYVLAGIIGFVGENPWAMRAVLAVAGATVAPLTYLLGRRLWGRGVALTGALLATFSFGLLVAAVSANTDAIYIPILVAQALLLVDLADAMAAGEARRRATVLLAVASGVLLGLGSLTRAEHLLLALAVPAVTALGRPAPGLRRIATISAVVFAAAAVIIAPWTIHNWISIGRFNQANPDLAEPLPRFVLVSNYGAVNFALANGEGADGTFRPELLIGKSADKLDFHEPRQIEIYLHGYREGLSYLASHPAGAAKLVARKLGISLEAGALGFGLSNRPGGLTGRRRPVDMFAPDSPLLLPFSAILTGLGLWVSRRHWRRGSPIVLAGIHKTVICAAFFGYVRLFVHLSPFGFLLQAAALAALVEMIGPGWRKIAAACGIAVAALLMVELGTGAVSPLNFTASGSSDPSNGKLIQDAEIRLAPAP
jgi:4-amino-4-deoxy-L-arabinose transferase-like glycosyltransferase